MSAVTFDPLESLRRDAVIERALAPLGLCREKQRGKPRSTE